MRSRSIGCSSIAVEETRLKIPVLFGYDVIHGLRTVLPVPIAMAATWDPDIVERGQAVAAAEARAIGLHWAFAPMVDIARDPRWGRMIEGAGEDPYLGSVMAAAQVRGFQGELIGSPGHIIAGPKHFAGYGAALGGRDYDEVDLSDNELWNVYLPPFKAAVEAGAGNIMSAYMGLNGVPATGNRWLLTEVLREAWGFQGFVVTDAGAAFDLRTHGYAEDTADAGVRALKAGVDMEMAPPFGQSAFQTLPQSLAAGRITMDELDAAVRRVLEAKVRMGLFEQPFVDLDEAERVLNDPAHRVTARIAAERSAVLLHNEGGLLPLDLDIGSIAVIGPFADAARDTVGPWVFQQDDAETVTILAGIRGKLGNGARVDYSPGVSVPARLFKSIFEGPPTSRCRAWRSTTTPKSTVRSHWHKTPTSPSWCSARRRLMIGEHASRSSLDLPGRQQELLDAVLATGKPTIVLLMSARPLDLKGSPAAGADDDLVSGYAGRRGDCQSLVRRRGAGRQAAVQLAAQHRADSAALCPSDLAPAGLGGGAVLERAELAALSVRLRAELRAVPLCQSRRVEGADRTRRNAGGAGGCDERRGARRRRGGSALHPSAPRLIGAAGARAEGLPPDHAGAGRNADADVPARSRAAALLDGSDKDMGSGRNRLRHLCRRQFDRIADHDLRGAQRLSAARRLTAERAGEAGQPPLPPKARSSA